MSRLKSSLFILLFIFNGAWVFAQTKSDQLRYPRVRAAYAASDDEIDDLLSAHNIERSVLRIYLRAFKNEGKLEIWAKNASDPQYVRIATYDICEKSGHIGPKRMQGDFQVPEGFYHIDRFNPASSYHLSLGINYPNKSDRVFSNKTRPGGDIFIHGECVTIGCLPMTNPIIQQIYVLCVEAKDAGQTTIPITIFPMKLTAEAIAKLNAGSNYSDESKALWAELKSAYDLFNLNKTLPSIRFLNNGRHQIE